MNEKIKNDASVTTKALIYQFYIALDKCFNLLQGQSLYIETYGDVTLSGESQAEVKIYGSDLTDVHPNIWKTLSNWLDEKFNESLYQSLILITTQDFGSTSKLKDWNKKTGDEKLTTLKDIYNSYKQKSKKSADTEKLLELVLDSKTEEKLKKILSKFSIDNSLNDDLSYYKNLVAKHCKPVTKENSENYLNSLLGFIQNPNLSNSTAWEITYQSFTNKVNELCAEFNSKTVIFPKKHALIKATSVELAKHDDYLFVKKIRDIDYQEVINDSIEDFIRTRNTILEDASRHQFNNKHIDEYEEQIHQSYKSSFQEAKLDVDETNHIKQSKKLFHIVTGATVPNFLNFNDTPRYFRNGLLHELADDVSKDIKWKLKGD